MTSSLELQIVLAQFSSHGPAYATYWGDQVPSRAQAKHKGRRHHDDVLTRQGWTLHRCPQKPNSLEEICRWNRQGEESGSGQLFRVVRDERTRHINAMWLTTIDRTYGHSYEIAFFTDSPPTYSVSDRTSFDGTYRTKLSVVEFAPVIMAITIAKLPPFLMENFVGSTSERLL